MIEIDRYELAIAFGIIGLYCLNTGDCDKCRLKELCGSGQIEDTLSDFAFRAAVRV